MSLVDVGVARPSHEQASSPYADPCLPRLYASATPDGTSTLSDDGEYDPAAEVKRLLKLETEVVERSVVVLPEATDRRSTLKDPQPSGRHIQHGIGSVEAHLRVKVTLAKRHHGQPHRP